MRARRETRRSRFDVRPRTHLRHATAGCSSCPRACASTLACPVTPRLERQNVAALRIRPTVERVREDPGDRIATVLTVDRDPALHLRKELLPARGHLLLKAGRPPVGGALFDLRRR